MVPVHLAGWMLSHVQDHDDSYDWVLILTADESGRLPLQLLLKGPRPVSVIMGLSHLRPDGGSKAHLDTVLADNIIPRTRQVDTAFDIQWGMACLQHSVI